VDVSRVLLLQGGHQARLLKYPYSPRQLGALGLSMEWRDMGGYKVSVRVGDSTGDLDKVFRSCCVGVEERRSRPDHGVY